MASSLSLVNARFGRLWARGHESFPPTARRILSVKGKGATTYLQGLVTSDLLQIAPSPREETIDPTAVAATTDEDAGSGSEYDVPPEVLNASVTTDMLRSTCFLDHKGRNMTDALLWKLPPNSDDKSDSKEDQYFIEVPATTADELLDHLKKYKMRRSKVEIDDKTHGMSAHTIVWFVLCLHNSILMVVQFPF